MIDIITRVRYPELYRKLQESAKENAVGEINFIAAFDDGQPKLAASYNLLALTAKADILLFVHDDVIILDKGWDQKIADAMELGFNVVGVVGTQKYQGGMIFDSGRQYSCGRVAGLKDGKRVVKVMDHHSDIEPVKVVDGMFMAVDRKHFLANPFDDQFDGLFYYDIDLCLRSNCAVADILISHEKPPHIYGKYPNKMASISSYSDAFNKKHGFRSDPQVGDQDCHSMLYTDYVKAAGAVCL